MDDRFREPAHSFSKYLGFEMVDWHEDYARFELLIRDVHFNRHETLHGGVHATLLDTAMGYAGCWTGDPEVRQMALTLSMTVQYLSRPKGQRLIAEGWKTGGGRSAYFARAEVKDDTGEMIATATGVFRYRKLT
ncbi:PaaI family thioesterase [Litorisediminicola beolgyonensis]|uniref:PaaI family thioesterase n=1 Tax=Litorisediminicola beolgyonensis TaxID=1173614 RepID=A0ABW3ZCL9_9RHOB